MPPPTRIDPIFLIENRQVLRRDLYFGRWAAQHCEDNQHQFGRSIFVAFIIAARRVNFQFCLDKLKMMDGRRIFAIIDCYLILWNAFLRNRKYSIGSLSCLVDDGGVCTDSALICWAPSSYLMLAT